MTLDGKIEFLINVIGVLNIIHIFIDEAHGIIPSQEQIEEHEIKQKDK